LLKNGHLLRFPAASLSRRRGKKSLLIRRDATPHPSGPPQAIILRAQTCICLPTEASAQAGSFLSNLEKIIFFSGPLVLKSPFLSLRTNADGDKN
jgi:hypothetical protein